MEDYPNKVLLLQYPQHIGLAVKALGLELEQVVALEFVAVQPYLKMSYFDIVVVNFEFVAKVNLNFHY